MSESIIPLDGSSLYTESTRTPNNNLGKDEFLNLLVAQMKYQNPLEPMSNTESIAQLAQFSALEQMTNVATAQNKASAYSLIGKFVAGNMYSEATGLSETITGMVDSVKVSGNDVFLRIGDIEMPLSGVTNITDANIDALSNINANIATSQSLALIGKNVQAVMTDTEGNVTKFVEGTVDYVKIAGGRTILMVNDLEIFAEEVLLVSDDKMLIGKPAAGVKKSADGVETEVTGTITGIEFDENKPYIVIDGEKFPISAISDVTEALNLIGKNVDTKDVSGKADGILVKDGTVYVKVGDKDVSIDIIKETLGNNKTSKEDEASDDTSGETEDEE